MAGIGFVLKKLSIQKNLSGIFRAFIYSTFISSGPWLFSIIALAIILALGNRILSVDGIRTFQIIVIYNFSFSFIVYGVLSLVMTRFISDSIYKSELYNIIGMMFSSLCTLYIIAVPFNYLFYFYTGIPTDIAVSATINFMILLGIWHISTFLSTLKSYKSISFAFFIGMFFAIFSAFTLGYKYSVLGFINGFTLGLCLILAVLFSFVFYEYPFKIEKPMHFFKAFKVYWPLAVSGAAYNIAIWVDKWIMWFSPDGVQSNLGGLRYDTNYSTAVFLGYLTIIPALGYFLFATETSFYEKILDFYKSLSEKATYEEIKTFHTNLINSFFIGMIDFTVLQGTIATIVVLTAHKILALIGVPMTQLGIFRYSVLSAFFILFVNYFVIVLYYFDDIKRAMFINLFFLVTNFIFTAYSVKLGFKFYGTGLFISSILTFVFAGILTFDYIKNLPFHTFITKNKRSKY